jgi:5-methylcytosine-specific restriction endonuclease McrA
MTYSEKLLDPRWQRKRLAVFERDNFACQVCGDTTNTLHVHHGYYARRVDPWDYPDCTLVTLCADCHTQVGLVLGAIQFMVGKLAIRPAAFMALYEHLIDVTGGYDDLPEDSETVGSV